MDVCVCVCVCVCWSVTALLSHLELFPIQMEGVKLTVNKGLSNHFQVSLPGPIILQRSSQPSPCICTYNPFTPP